MDFAELLLNAACIFPACAAGLKWIGVTRRRWLSTAAVAAALALCSNCIASYYLRGFPLTTVLIVILIPVSLMNPKVSGYDACAAASITGASYGASACAVREILAVGYISLFFRIALAVLALILFFVVPYLMRPVFPGKNWYDILEDEPGTPIFARFAVRFCAFLCVYWAACSLPFAVKAESPVLLVTLICCQIGGIALFSILLENRSQAYSLALQRQTNDELQTFMSIVRSQRHDYNIHVQTLYELTRENRHDEAAAYLNRLAEDTMAMNRLLPLADAAVSALILSFQNEAARMGINMEISVENDLGNIATNTYETNKIIGNLLQNALDETSLLEDKSFGIHLTVLKRGEYAVIKVSNRTRNAMPMSSYSIGRSSKTGHEGIGIASIRALASRYGGTVYSKEEGHIIHFTAKIPIRLAKERE